MARPRNRLIDYLVYLAVRVAGLLSHMSSPEMNRLGARWAGRLIWTLDRPHRRIALGHLRRSFPEWPEGRIRRVARESFEHLACLGLEVLLAPRLITAATWRRHIRLVNMAETVRMLTRQESGLVVLTGHFGNWEIISYMMATLGFPTVSVARPLDNPHLNELILGVRERTGQTILHKRGATESMSDVIERGGVLAFLADQDAGRKGLFVDFFGRSASTHRSVGLLATHYGVPVVIGYGRRLGGAFRFEVGIRRIIRPPEWAGRADPVTWITRTFTAELEGIVREAPAQYLWAHRRWKHRPDGTRAGGDGVA